MASLMLKKEENLVKVFIEVYRHTGFRAKLQGVWQGRPRGGLVGLSTSKRSQIDDVQYPRIPSRILKGASHEEVSDDVIPKVAMSGIGRC
jgi:hypothetical protein